MAKAYVRTFSEIAPDEAPVGSLVELLTDLTSAIGSDVEASYYLFCWATICLEAE